MYSQLYKGTTVKTVVARDKRELFWGEERQKDNKDFEQFSLNTTVFENLFKHGVFSYRKVMSDQPCKLPLERNGFQIYVLVFVNFQMHASIIVYMIWKVLPPGDGTVCSLCQLKGEGS